MDVFRAAYVPLEYKTRRIQYRNVNRYQLDRKKGILQSKSLTHAFSALEFKEVNPWFFTIWKKNNVDDQIAFLTKEPLSVEDTDAIKLKPVLVQRR